MKMMFNIVLIFLGFCICSCSLDDETNNESEIDYGEITGADYRMCVCCGGFYIEISNNIYRFYDFPDSASSIINDSSAFPIPVEVAWEKPANQCIGDEIVIKSMELTTKRPDPIIIVTVFPDSLESDYTIIDSVSISGDMLNMMVSYSGGCVKGHGFELYASSLFMESYPVQAQLKLIHDNKGDLCKRLVYDTLSFDLSSLKNAYIQGYISGSGEIKLRIYTVPDSVNFEPMPLYSF